MKVIVASCCCSRQQNERLFALRKKAMIIPAQKFMDMVLSGIAMQKDVEIDNLCIRAVSAGTCDIRKWEYETELSEDGIIRYEYIPFTNGKYSRFISTLWNEYRYCKRRIREAKKAGEQVVLLTDVTIWNAAISAKRAADKCGIPSVCIVTDLPQYVNAKKAHKKVGRLFHNILKRVSQKSMQSYDAYILLTEAMKDIVVKNNQSYVVTECLIDPDDIPREDSVKQDKCVFLYAGGVYEKYGLKVFVEAFEKVANDSMELQIFGDGDFVPELEKNPERYPHTVYKGCVSLAEIVDYERQATVLVNPRPIGEEYTKYSFPSKTAEYMTTGVAVLSTPLKGIPDEYRPYAIWFEGDTEEDYKRGIKKAAEMPIDDLKKLGKAAQTFCLRNKTKEIQGKKIVDLLKEVIDNKNPSFKIDEQ